MLFDFSGCAIILIAESAEMLMVGFPTNFTLISVD